MSIPMKWAEGDKCAVRRNGEVIARGVVAGLGDGCASVTNSTGKLVVCSRDELDLDVDLPPKPLVLVNDAPFQMLDADGSVHFTHLKRIALSGKQYLESLKPFDPTGPMLLGTCIHALVLGPRPEKPIAVYPGKVRSGKEWEKFFAENVGAEIVTAKEWSKAEEIADAVLRDPLAKARLEGAKFEVPLVWEENGMKCSTSGVDIISGGALGDLKTTATVHPETLMRQAFRMSYHCQLAFYRRGARANGYPVPNGLFLLAVETRSPFEVVDLELTDGLIDLADRTVSLWLEQLRVYVECRQFPGYAQSPIPWDVPGWAQTEEDEEEEAA